jgi:lipase ATG15
VTDPEDVRVVDPTGASIKYHSKLVARSESLKIERLTDRSQEHIDYLLDAGRMRGEPLALDASAWTIDDVPGPNVTDKETLLSIAHIAANAYLTSRDDPEWFDVGVGFNYTNDFGWEMDGLRGHIFADEQNQTVIVGLKGTCKWDSTSCGG